MPVNKDVVLLNEALRLGEEHSDRYIQLNLKLRKLTCHMYKIRALIRTGRPSEALELLEYCISMVRE